MFRGPPRPQKTLKNLWFFDIFGLFRVLGRLGAVLSRLVRVLGRLGLSWGLFRRFSENLKFSLGGVGFGDSFWPNFLKKPMVFNDFWPFLGPVRLKSQKIDKNPGRRRARFWPNSLCFTMVFWPGTLFLGGVWGPFLGASRGNFLTIFRKFGNFAF